MTSIILVVFYVFFPLFILHLCYKFPIINKIGAIVIAYIIGFVIGNIGILPFFDGYESKLDLLTTITVPLAIPLLLFSTNLKKWVQIAGKTMVSMVLALVAVLITVFAGYFIFRGQGIHEPWDVSGMLIGLYSGGTPNLASIKVALGADETNFMIIATYDIVVGAFHLLFVMTIAQRVFSLFLPRYKFIDSKLAQFETIEAEEPFWGLLKKRRRLSLLKSFGLAVLIFGIAGATTLFIPESSQMAVVILIITTLGILASLVPAINRIDKSYDLGMYLILIFCMVVASMADISQLSLTSLVIGAYVLLVVFGSLLVHAILAKIFKIDTDTFIITSTAFICSPPFVPIVAAALKNREIVFSGLAVGILGYALGNYLGVLVSWVLKLI